METYVYEELYQFEGEYWWHKARRELLLQILSQIHQENESKALKILDLGCGTGLNLKQMGRYGDAVGLDYYDDALIFSKSRGISDLVRASGEKLPFKEGVFDVVCALDVLEHIEDDVKVMEDLHRVIATAGYFILTVPAFEALWGEHDVASHHVRRYSKSQLLRNLEKCGFVVSKCAYWNFHLFPFVWMARKFLSRPGTSAKSDIRKLPWAINRALLCLLRLENKAITMNIAFPFGVSILCICKKEGRDSNEVDTEK